MITLIIHTIRHKFIRPKKYLMKITIDLHSIFIDIRDKRTTTGSSF